MNLIALLEKVFGNRVYTVRANDGGLYSEKQYEDAEELIFKSGYHRDLELSRLYLVCSITVIDGRRALASFYMRDLVRGIVRDNEESKAEYQVAVRRAGWAGE